MATSSGLDPRVHLPSPKNSRPIAAEKAMWVPYRVASSHFHRNARKSLKASRSPVPAMTIAREMAAVQRHVIREELSGRWVRVTVSLLSRSSKNQRACSMMAEAAARLAEQAYFKPKEKHAPAMIYAFA